MTAAGSGTPQAQMHVIKALRRLAWAQTKSAIVADGQVAQGQLTYPAAPTRRVLPPLRRARARGAAVLRVSVLRADMLAVAGARLRAGVRVAVLNMAAASKPGGGVDRGAGAQEEDLHRRTDAWRFLRLQHHLGPDAPGIYPIRRGTCLLSTG
eukprot:15460810-Alexandrium_andersonii.AAC.1